MPVKWIRARSQRAYVTVLTNAIICLDKGRLGAATKFASAFLGPHQGRWRAGWFHAQGTGSLACSRCR